MSYRRTVGWIIIVFNAGFCVAAGIFLLVAHRSIIEGPYLSLFKRLQPRFYFDTFLIISSSALLITPLSYGISNYVMEKSKGASDYKNFFILFIKPLLLIKAVVMRISIWVLRGSIQLLALLIGVAVETLIILLYCICKESDVLSLSVRELPQLIEAVGRYRGFYLLSAVLWIGVAITFFISYLQFVLCKYALLRFGELSIREAVGIGRSAVRGRLFLLFYRLVEKYTYYIIIIGSFGLLRDPMGKSIYEPFSLTAARWVEQGRELYFFNKKIS